MNGQEARNLRVGERVKRAADGNNVGTVIVRGPNYIEIRWDDGIRGALHPEDCRYIEKAEVKS